MKFFLLIIIGVIILISGIKIYFEINNYFYQKTIKEMKETNEISINITEHIEHKTLEQDGYEIHYYVSGKKDKDLIIFLHPAFSDHRAFNQQIDFFSKDFRVITIDLIGHGLSEINKSKDKIDISTKHINEIMKIEEFDNAHFVGVSMGSLIAQYFAFEYPQKTKSLTALGGYDIHQVNKEVVKAQRSVNLKLIFRAIFSIKSFRKETAKNICKSEKGQVLFYETTSHYKRKSFKVMQGLQNVIKDRKNVSPQYPTLILIGESDIELSKKMAKEWHDEINNSKYFMIENAGHCANIDNPNKFNELVNNFIKQQQLIF